MTQPAVTQHIKYLEAEYNCKLFEYQSKVLSKTEKCLELEQYALGLVYAEQSIVNKLGRNPVRKIAIGATKTIGEYTIEDKTLKLMERTDIELHLVIDNTKNLLQQLENLELDILMLEGYFDKNRYGYQMIKQERVIGICAKNHPFAGREVELEELFDEHLILREEGSGTRSIFEHFLEDHNYSVESFAKKSVISTYKLIEKAVAHNLGVSFVYQSVLDENKFASFQVKENKIQHEFNYVFLRNADVKDVIQLIES